MCISPTSSHLLLFTSSLTLRVYDIPKSLDPIEKPIHPIRTIPRAHDAPVHVCTTDPTSTYLASGSADGVVKVWNIARGYVTHVFKGHGGVVSALVFNYPFDPSAVAQQPKMQLITASVDTRIRIFYLSSASARSGASAKPQAVLEGHVSVPRGLDVTRDGKWLVSGGRDSVVLVWDMAEKTEKDAKVKSGKGKGKEKDNVLALVQTIPVLERVEAVGILRTYDEGSAGITSGARKLQVYTAGEKGVIKVWDVKTAKVLFTLGQEQENLDEEQEEQRQITSAM